MSLYEVFNVLSGIILLCFNLSHVKTKEMDLGCRTTRVMRHCVQKDVPAFLKTPRFWAVIELFVISVVQYVPAPAVNTALGDIVGTGVNYFGLLLVAPVMLTVLCLLLGTNPLRQIDMVAPAFPLALAFAKLGCFCAGCCSGIICDLGFYTRLTGRADFPIQLVESMVALLLFAVLISMEDRMKEGTVFPVYIMTYSGIRFFTEFLRDDPVVLWGLKTYQLLCVVGVVVGLSEYAFASKFRTKISRLFDKNTVVTK